MLTDVVITGFNCISNPTINVSQFLVFTSRHTPFDVHGTFRAFYVCACVKFTDPYVDKTLGTYGTRMGSRKHPLTKTIPMYGQCGLTLHLKRYVNRILASRCAICNNIQYLNVNTTVFSPHGATAHNGPGPPHYRGFTITFRHTTPGMTPLDE